MKKEYCVTGIHLFTLLLLLGGILFLGRAAVTAVHLKGMQELSKLTSENLKKGNYFQGEVTALAGSWSKASHEQGKWYCAQGEDALTGNCFYLMETAQHQYITAEIPVKFRDVQEIFGSFDFDRSRNEPVFLTLKVVPMTEMRNIYNNYEPGRILGSDGQAIDETQVIVAYALLAIEPAEENEGFQAGLTLFACGLLLLVYCLKNPMSSRD